MKESVLKLQTFMSSISKMLIVFCLFFWSNISSSQSRNASYSKDGSTIVYVSNVDGINQIFTMNTNGSNKKQLTYLQHSCYYPFFSPDASKIVFMSLAGEHTIICLIDKDGSNYKALSTEKDMTSDPNWSPDGSQLIFSSAKGGNNNIYVMDVTGKNWKQLTHHEASDQTPSISPDGKHIVFVSNRDGNNELYIMNSDGTNVKRLTTDPRSDRVPRWSPDSEKIIWYSREPSKVAGSAKKSWSGAEIYEIQKNGSNRKQITHNSYRDQGPNYVPGKNRVIFTSKRTGTYQLFDFNLETSEVTQLTNKNE
ncbi:DUF5050 domain-containing protein [uncultured Psychroserpens sp.]|uniref:TolB family protein n=1 Tax=uncultured Psychroserpens sp. TaxID=255436 RepID=UPI002615C49A|nr:DUF5050 domain-containing protein [uncultured Psychroserpens sp.]